MNRYLKNIFSDHVKANQLSAVIRFGVALLISVLLVRSHLTDAAVGTLEYAVLISYTCSFFWAFAYSSGIMSRIASYDEQKWKSLLQDVFTQLVGIATIMAGSLFILLVVLQSKGMLLFASISKYQVVVYCFCLIVGIIPEVFYLLYKKAKSLIYYSLFFNLLLLIGVSVSLFYRLSIEEIFYVYIVLQMSRFVLGIYLVKPMLTWNFFQQKAWFIFILPLVIHFILGSSMDYIDGHLVAYFFDEEQFLYYRYGARELPFSLLFINAISAALIPVLSQDISELSDLKNRISKLMHFLFPVSIVFLFLAPPLFRIVYGQQFEVSSWVFNIYILILSSRILMPQLVLYAKMDNRALMIFSGIELLVNIGLSVLLLQFWGIYGIAVATVFAFAVNKFLTSIYCNAKYDIKLNQYINIRTYILYMLALLVAFFISFQLFYG